MSADTIELELAPDGPSVRWEAELIRALGGDGHGSDRPWRIEGSIDWDAVESLAVVSAAFEDGRLLAIAAVRPADAEGHDAALLRGLLVEPGGEPVELADALLSTEYDAEGAPARIGIELFTDADALPLRVAADREARAPAGDAGGDVTPMSFRMEGTRGAGAFERVRGG